MNHSVELLSCCARRLFQGVLLITLGGLAVARLCFAQGDPLRGSGNVAALHAPPAASAYAGDAACASCHEKEARAYLASPHHHDSSVASAKTILGNFTPGKNVLRTPNPNLIFAMIAAPDGFYQSAVDIADPQHLRGEAQRFDIVIGSGRRGQTYLYWKDDELFELPVTYWTETHAWINSPGYIDGGVHFDRPIPPRCLECHATYFQTAAPPGNRYVKDSLVLGIGCEKCHGPGAEHVRREQSAHPPAPGSPEEAIVNPARLSPARQMDLCALCHAGAGEPVAPALSYQPGDVLADYVQFPAPTGDVPVDVHGSQVEALERSRCFTSGKLSCATCHNVHEKQETADAFSKHCLTCHAVQACGRFKQMGEAIRTKCVECHMPMGWSQALTSQSDGQLLRAHLRQHRIAIYPQAPGQ